MEDKNPPLDTRAMTWAALLGRWVDFARSGVALGDDPESMRMKQSIADIIMLQAVYFALQHLADLPSDEKALGLDRAELLIRRHGDMLEKRYAADVMPQTMKELIDDARGQLKRVQQADQSDSA